MQLGWIDFSRQDKADAINIINSMKEKGVERTPLSIYWNGLRTFQFFQSANLNFTYADFMMRVFTFARSKAESKAWIKSSKKDDGDDFDAGNFSKINPLARLETYSKTMKIS